jgi:hypothetical protein
MVKVKNISSPNDMPVGEHYVLVKYGEVYEQTREPLGLTITVARQQSKTVSDLSFLTAVHTAKELAKQEGISTVFACTSSLREWSAQHSGALLQERISRCWS